MWSCVPASVIQAAETEWEMMMMMMWRKFIRRRGDGWLAGDVVNLLCMIYGGCCRFLWFKFNTEVAISLAMTQFDTAASVNRLQQSTHLKLRPFSKILALYKFTYLRASQILVLTAVSLICHVRRFSVFSYPWLTFQFLPNIVLQSDLHIKVKKVKA